MNLYVVSDKQGSGKTFITAGIAATMQSLGYSVGYYKPVQINASKQNGYLHSQDITFVKKIDPNLSTTVSYVLETNAIPFLASQKENTPIEPQVIITDFLKLRKTTEMMIIEGYNGLITPISENIETYELIKSMQAQLLIVVEPSAEALEKVLLMIFYAKFQGIKIRGVILNKYLHTMDINIKNLASMIELHSGVPVVGIVNYQEKITPSGLIDLTLHSIDLETIFDMPIPKLDNYTDN